MKHDDGEAGAPPLTEKRGPNEPRSPSSTFLGADEGGDKAKAQQAQARPIRKVLRDDERLRPIGGPRVLIEYLPWETRVRLDKSTWGFANTDKTWLGTGRRSAERYAQELFGRLCEAADSATHYKLTKKRGNGTLREIARALAKREQELGR